MSGDRLAPSFSPSERVSQASSSQQSPKTVRVRQHRRNNVCFIVVMTFFSFLDDQVSLPNTPGSTPLVRGSLNPSAARKISPQALLLGKSPSTSQAQMLLRAQMVRIFCSIFKLFIIAISVPHMHFTLNGFTHNATDVPPSHSNGNFAGFSSLSECCPVTLCTAYLQSLSLVFIACVCKVTNRCFLMFLIEVSHAHQDCILFDKNTEKKTVII